MYDDVSRWMEYLFTDSFSNGSRQIQGRLLLSNTPNVWQHFKNIFLISRCLQMSKSGHVDWMLQFCFLRLIKSAAIITLIKHILLMHVRLRVIQMSFDSQSVIIRTRVAQALNECVPWVVNIFWICLDSVCMRLQCWSHLRDVSAHMIVVQSASSSVCICVFITLTCCSPQWGRWLTVDH